MKNTDSIFLFPNHCSISIVPMLRWVIEKHLAAYFYYSLSIIRQILQSTESFILCTFSDRSLPHKQIRKRVFNRATNLEAGLIHQRRITTKCDDWYRILEHPHGLQQSTAGRPNRKKNQMRYTLGQFNWRISCSEDGSSMSELQSSVILR